MCLKQTLPDGYAVVADPVVLGYALGAVVVGAAGVTILEAGNGRVGEEPARRALQAFLKDEFPSLKPAIRYLRVQRRPGTESPGWDALEPTTMYTRPVAEAITEADSASAYAAREYEGAAAAGLRQRALQQRALQQRAQAARTPRAR